MTYSFFPSTPPPPNRSPPAAPDGDAVLLLSAVRHVRHHAADATGRPMDVRRLGLARVRLFLGHFLSHCDRRGQYVWLAARRADLWSYL